jgi:hypothetical protein
LRPLEVGRVRTGPKGECEPNASRFLPRQRRPAGRDDSEAPGSIPGAASFLALVASFGNALGRFEVVAVEREGQVAEITLQTITPIVASAYVAPRSAAA